MSTGITKSVIEKVNEIKGDGKDSGFKVEFNCGMVVYLTSTFGFIDYFWRESGLILKLSYRGLKI